MDEKALQQLAVGTNADVSVALHVLDELKKLAAVGVLQHADYEITPPLGRPAEATCTLSNAVQPSRGKLGLSPR